MNNLITIPFNYNPIYPKNDTKFVFRWVCLSDNDNPFPWIKDGWDFVGSRSGKNIYRLIKPSFKYPTPFQQPNLSNHMIQFLSENKEDDFNHSSDQDSLSSISENISYDPLHDSSPPLPSPLVFKNNNTSDTPPIKLNNPNANTFYSAVHF